MQKYDNLTIAMRGAGFFTSNVEEMGDWDRITVCAKRVPSGKGYCGNSFWITRLSVGWFLGTWGGFLYRIPDESRLTEFCVQCLTNNPDDTASDFEDQIKEQFGLVSVSDAEFDAFAGKTVER